MVGVGVGDMHVLITLQVSLHSFTEKNKHLMHNSIHLHKLDLSNMAIATSRSYNVA